MVPRNARRLRFVAVAGLLAASFYTGVRLVPRALAPSHPVTGRPIAGIATNADWLERPERVAEEAPDEALALIGVRPGMIVADVGAGTGYMTTRLARLVGPTGKVYANEVQPAMLRILNQRVDVERLGNVQVVQGTATDAALPQNAIDLALLVDVYHELRYPQAMLRSIRQSLKPDGQLVVLEYRKEDPRIPIADTHRTSVIELRHEIEPEGYVLERVIEGLPRQHIVIFGSTKYKVRSTKYE